MTNEAIQTIDLGDTSAIDIGRPVEYLVDPENPAILLGVTYLFTVSGIRRTVWHTRNKRRAKSFVVVSEPALTPEDV